MEKKRPKEMGILEYNEIKKIMSYTEKLLLLE
jgi:hypothetical protein